MPGEYDEVLDLARALQSAVGREKPAAPQPALPDPLRQFDELVTDEDLRAASRRLFADGHYAQAVEEGFKYLDSLVQQR